jgi:hypothetical protein
MTEEAQRGASPAVERGGWTGGQRLSDYLELWRRRLRGWGVAMVSSMARTKAKDASQRISVRCNKVVRGEAMETAALSPPFEEVK